MFQHADGTVISAYCHFDGYLDHNGRLLNTCYDCDDDARQLVEGGDLSFIHETIKLSFYYDRDRGEPGAEAQTFPDLSEALFDAEAIVYLFVEGDTWWVRMDGQWHKLDDALTSAA
jgi:hypothetical protein